MNSNAIHPIIYVRGYAMTQTEIEDTVADPYMGFNLGSGHRFDRGETLLLAALLKLVMENAWDADVLCSVRGRADKVRARISHDEWFELLGPPPELAESAGWPPLI